MFFLLTLCRERIWLCISTDGDGNGAVPTKEGLSLGFLKMPKCEIFDRSDFPDFYTIKSLRVGDFGVKIKNL